MGISRRSFLSRSVALASTGATAKLIPFKITAEPVYYGPQTGLAQLHWNENYYGPSELAIQAIQESSHKGAYSRPNSLGILILVMLRILAGRLSEWITMTT